jgi:hypothetical protein
LKYRRHHQNPQAQGSQARGFEQRNDKSLDDEILQGSNWMSFSKWKLHVFHLQHNQVHNFVGLHSIRTSYQLHVNRPNVFGSTAPWFPLCPSPHGVVVCVAILSLQMNFLHFVVKKKKTNCCQHYYHANNGLIEKRVSGLRGASPSCRHFFLRWRLLSVSLPIVLRAAETARDPGNFNSWGLGRLELWAGRDFRDKSHPSAKMSPSRVRGH